MPDVLFRYEDVVYAAPFDETGALPGTLKVELHEYQILRRTPKGAWLTFGFDSKKFVRLTADRPWASPTKEDAFRCFKERKKIQIRILTVQLDRAKEALRKANEL